MKKSVAALAGAIALAVVGASAYIVMQGRAPSPISEAEAQPAFTPVPHAAPGDYAGFTEEQRAAIGAIVRDYLLTNPQVLEEVVAELERRRNAEQQAVQAEALVAYNDQLFSSDYQVVLGNPEGDVTLVEFFDYNCTYCRQGHADLMRLLGEDSGLRVVLKEYPVLGAGSVEAAQVAIAVNEVAPDRYLQFHDTMFTTPGQANVARALAVADQLGIDGVAVRAAMEDDVVTTTIEEVYMLAEALGVTGTPTYVVGDEVVVGAVGYAQLAAKIEAVRACGATIC